MKLHLGCGHNKLDGYVNIDFNTDCDIKLDLENEKLPFEDCSVEEVKADHFFEHIRNFLPLMNEINRVLVPGGVCSFKVPHRAYDEAYSDPTHVRYFTEKTFLYFLKDAYFHTQCGESYGILPFSDLSLWIKDWELSGELIK